MARTTRARATAGLVPAQVSISLQRIASAFEVPLLTVQDDADLLRTWRGEAAELRDALRLRHDWDASVAPYYVRWLTAATCGA
jgi:hypothetical protein